MIREEQVQAPVQPPVEAVPITVTPMAAEKLREVMAQKGVEEAGLRVFVSGGGCSGLQYGMAFETQVEDDDVAFASEGLNVYVDPVSILYLQGSVVDYVDSLMGGGFKIENPNASSSCGCGSSFKTEGGQEGQGLGKQAPGGGCAC